MAAGFGDRVWSGIRNLAGGASGAIDATLNEHRIRLAVTGLSRSGKTVFITSLIQNLIALGGGRDTLPRIAQRLARSGRSRLKAVRLLPAGVETLPYFDFRAHLAALAADQPTWPERTQNLSQISLALEMEHESGLRQRLGNKRVRLDILDYPGEWLLDLPLLDRTFGEWSGETVRALMEPPRHHYAGAFLSFLRSIGPNDPADEAILRHGHELYRRTIEACRREAGLHYLQPGRFLCPGPHGDAPFMWFFPLPAAAETAAAGSTAGLLRDRFETYKHQVRADFFDSHFRDFNRQIMLVDVLAALHAGQTAFDDTARAVRDLAIGLRDGWGFWNRRRRQAVADGIGQGGRHIASRTLRRGGWVIALPVSVATTALSAVVAPRAVERVAFVATKADHVADLNRSNLRNLLGALAEPAAESWADVKTAVFYHVAAAIRSTEDGTATMGGRDVQVVKGVVLGEDKARPFYVGQVPSTVPPASFWSSQYFEMPVFRPPLIEASGAAGIRHLGMDEVLDAAIGDLL